MTDFKCYAREQSRRGMTRSLRIRKLILTDHVEELGRNHLGNYSTSPGPSNVFNDEGLSEGTGSKTEHEETGQETPMR